MLLLALTASIVAVPVDDFQSFAMTLNIDHSSCCRCWQKYAPLPLSSPFSSSMLTAPPPAVIDMEAPGAAKAVFYSEAFAAAEESSESEGSQSHALSSPG